MASYSNISYDHTVIDDIAIRIDVIVLRELSPTGALSGRTNLSFTLGAAVTSGVVGCTLAALLLLFSNHLATNVFDSARVKVGASPSDRYSSIERKCCPCAAARKKIFSSLLTLSVISVLVSLIIFMVLVDAEVMVEKCRNLVTYRLLLRSCVCCGETAISRRMLFPSS